MYLLPVFFPPAESIVPDCVSVRSLAFREVICLFGGELITVIWVPAGLAAAPLCLVSARRGSFDHLARC